jgi:hypothetical protein
VPSVLRNLHTHCWAHHRGQDALAIVVPGQPKESSIAVETREGRSVPNSQSRSISQYEEHQVNEQRRRHPNALFRTNAIPAYNCHGLTFAARRTAVWQTPAILDILKDDRYTDVDSDDVQPGDVILYVSPEDGEIEHSGIVVERPDPRLHVPRVWSKWGHGCEVVHMASDCPYSFSSPRYIRIQS